MHQLLFNISILFAYSAKYGRKKLYSMKVTNSYFMAQEIYDLKVSDIRMKDASESITLMGE